MSTCGATAEFADPDGDAYNVWCSMPAGHAEEHAGRVWWPNDSTATAGVGGADQ